MTAGRTIVQSHAAEQLAAVGTLLGVEVTVVDGAQWHLDIRGLQVGIDWYLQRGHGEQEAAALAALQLWEGPREFLGAPERARRASALARARPQLVPLLGSVRRAQAMGELLAAMPGLRSTVQAAVCRTLPGDLGTLPRHLQWACLVLASSLPQSLTHRMGGEDPAVVSEWQAMLAAAGGDAAELHALRRLFAPRQGVTPLRRFERVLAFTLPAYERLLALDTADRVHPTVLGGSDRAELSLQADEALGSDDFAPGSEECADENPAGEAEPNEAERERTTGSPEADALFESARERFAQTVLATPIADAQALLAAMRPPDEAAPPVRNDAAPLIGDAASAGAATTEVTLATYRSRAEQLAPAIDGVRAIWQGIVAERIAPRRSRSRRPLPDGDELASDWLASAVAQTLAGAHEPEAFTRLVTKPRLTRSTGSSDYVFMIDRSASMAGALALAAADTALIMIEALAAAERDIAHAERVAGFELELDIRSCLIVFAAEATVLKPLAHGLDDTARHRLFSEIRSPAGSTNDAAALRLAGEQLGIGREKAHPVAGPARRRIAILVGDGGTNDAPAAARELQLLRAAGVSVHAVGIATDDLAARYAPQGASIDDARRLPEALAGIIEREL